MSFEQRGPYGSRPERMRAMTSPDAEQAAESSVLSNFEANRTHRRRLSSRSNALSVFSDVLHDVVPEDEATKTHRRKPTLQDVAMRVRTLTAMTRGASSRKLGANNITSREIPPGMQGFVFPPSTVAASIEEGDMEPANEDSDPTPAELPVILPPAAIDASEQQGHGMVPGEQGLTIETESPFDAIYAAPLPQKQHPSTPSNTEHLFKNVETLDMLFHKSQMDDAVNAMRQSSNMDLSSETSGSRQVDPESFATSINQLSPAFDQSHSNLEGREYNLDVPAVNETSPLTDTKPKEEPPSSFFEKLAKRIEHSTGGLIRFRRSNSSKSMTGGTRSDKSRGKYTRGTTPKRSSAHTALKDVVSPRVMLEALGVSFLRSSILLIILPGLIMSTVLFYGLNNPGIDFLPGQASMSWWLLFAVRQCVTFHLARITEYILVEALALRSAIYLQLCGPLLTLFVIQSKGWPFVLASWGVWDLILIHDSNLFSKNWLFFLRISMLSQQNPNGNVLNSDMYLRILLAFIIAGVATAIKRTYLALYLGKRTFVHYKPQLNKIISDMKLLAEVADLAAEVGSPEFEHAISMAEKAILVSPGKKVVPWDIQFQADGKKQKVRENKEEEKRVSMSGVMGDEESFSLVSSSDDDSSRSEASSSIGDDDEEDEESTSSSERRGFKPWGAQDSFGTLEGKEPSSPNKKKNESFDKTVHDVGDNRPRMDSSVDHLTIKRQLDRWDDPVGKSNKMSDPSMHDILQFRKALTYMEDACPFSLSFGPADTRDRCIRSSQRLYKKLLKYTPELDTLQYSVISALAFDDNGNWNESKNKALTRLFRPDMNKEITRLAFVQSCDTVYKRLRFFLAGVGNSVIIDGVLEKIVNSFFYLILSLLLLALLNFDPWRLLVSLSTLTVSFAFAFGPSTAEYIDGILLIAVRRPFDLGDRIAFASPQGTHTPGQTWFVEDITLTTTTLRFAATNEVATISNASVAKSRILNGSRSHRAVVALNFLFKLDTTHEQLQKFLARVEKYVKNRPRTWTSVIQFRNEKLDPLGNRAEYSLRVQHRKTWQDEGSIYRSQADLNDYCNELSRRMGIRFQCLPTCLEVSLSESRQTRFKDESDYPPRPPSCSSMKKEEMPKSPRSSRHAKIP